MDINTETTAASDALRICLKCKHVGTNASRDVETYKCFSPCNPYSIDLVSGDKIYVEEYCRQQRGYATDWSGVCSTAGNWYEAKPAAPTTPTPYSVTPVTAAKLKIKLATNLLEDLGL